MKPVKPFPLLVRCNAPFGGVDPTTTKVGAGRRGRFFSMNFPGFFLNRDFYNGICTKLLTKGSL